MTREGFTAQYRILGMAAAWVGFVVMQAYSLASGLGFLSLETPQGAVGYPYLQIMSLLIILMVPLILITMIAVHAYAAPEHKAFSLAALVLLIPLAPITSSVNFALLLVGSQAGLAEAPWLSLFLPYRWPAVAYALDVFAWDWFFALSMLCAAVVFRLGRLAQLTRLAMLISGGLSLVGLALLPFSAQWAIGISLLGWGVAGSVVFLLLAILFSRTPAVSAVLDG